MFTVVVMILHITLLVTATGAHQISSTPPRIAQSSSNHLLRAQDEQKASPQSDSSKAVLHGPRYFNRIGMVGVAASRYAAWIVTVLEVTARLLSSFPSSPVSRAILPILLPKPGSGVSIPPVPPPQMLLSDAPSPIFVLSVLSIFVGFAIRRKCFNAMGRHFSFTHTTLDEHQLVRSGPYCVVRHPSYTGEVLVRGGMAILLLAPGGFVRSCGAFQKYQLGFAGNFGSLQMLLLASVQVAVVFYIGWVSFASTYLIWRAPQEDASLHETFGRQWEKYAKEVPYRFIPHVV